MATEVEIFGFIDQLEGGVLRDGEKQRIRMNRDGALQVNTREALVDLWTRQGRVMTVSNPVIGQPETCSGAGTAVVLTDPTLRYTVPAGAVVVPIHVQFELGQVTAKNNLLHVIASETDTYSSGGDAVKMTPYNLAMHPNNVADGPVGVTKLEYSDTSIVEAALVRPRLLKTLRSEGLADASVDPTSFEYNILKGDQMVYMEGPASFLVYLTQETTAAEAEWSMSWAVLRAASIGR